MITREFNLYLHAGHSIPLVINVNQYDRGEQWLFTLYNSDGTQYVPSSGAIVGIKSDNLGIINTATVDASGRVVINETQQMTAAVGKAVFELVIDDGTHGTANFVVLVEEKPGNNADLSETDISMIEEAIEAASTIKPYGSPLVASTVAGMTDHEKVYVYVGSETGYTSGNWYYWNGSAWASGGVYNSVAVQTDTTLTLSGVAADSKKVGDEISDLKSEIESGTGGGMSVSAINQLISVLQHGLYDADQTSAILQLQALLLENIPATITYSLTGVTSSNASTSITTGNSYTTTLTPTDPTHTITSVSVEMSGLDITNTAYNSSTGVISIGAVSGNVTITARAAYVQILYNWDFTQSLTDTLQGTVATTTATQGATGLSFTTANTYARLVSNVSFRNKTIEMDFSANSTFKGSTMTHGRVLGFSNSDATNSNTSTLCWKRTDSVISFYLGSAWDENTSDKNWLYFAGKTMRVYIDASGYATMSVSSDRVNYETILTSAGILSTYSGLIIGSKQQDNLVGLLITGLRIYEGEVTS